MTKLQRIVGLKTSIDKCPPQQLAVERWSDIEGFAEEKGIDINDYHVFLHDLRIKATKNRFFNTQPLDERLDSIAIRYYVNPKQQKKNSILVMNHLFEGRLMPKWVYARRNCVVYTYQGTMPDDEIVLENQLVIFIHKSVPLRHRKVRIVIAARTSQQARELLPEKFRKDHSSKFQVRCGVSLHITKPIFGIM